MVYAPHAVPHVVPCPCCAVHAVSCMLCHACCLMQERELLVAGWQARLEAARQEETATHATMKQEMDVKVGQ